MDRWRNFLKKNLGLTKNTAKNPEIFSCNNVDVKVAAPAILKMFSASKLPLVVALPETGSVEYISKEIDELASLCDIKIPHLVIPESGRGKVLFPGGESRRARALDAILSNKYQLFLGSVHSLLGPAPPPKETKESSFTIKVGMQISIKDLVSRLVVLDYDDELEVVTTGEFARRGGIVDIFSPGHDFPCRIEFFGDEVDSIRSFSPTTQRSTGSITEYNIIGRSGITAGGAASSNVFEYFNNIDYRLLVIHPQECKDILEKYSIPEAADQLDDIIETKLNENKAGLFFDGAEYTFIKNLLPLEYQTRSFTEHSIINGHAIWKEKAEELFALELVNYLHDLFSLGGRAVLLVSYLEDLPMLEKWCEKYQIDKSKVEFDISKLSNSIIFTNEKLIVVAESELLSAGLHRNLDVASLQEEDTKIVSSEEVASQLPEFSLVDLTEGDLAVHLDFGIGIFRGIDISVSANVHREVLKMEYQGNTIISVPMLHAHKISRYVGDINKVRIHSITTKRWNKEIEQAQSGVKTYAQDMLRMQAYRQSAPGIAFDDCIEEDAAFLRSFPYKDTPDQKRTTQEIRRDMTSSRPMDRLLCGDVGYGKTEIAMRAALRAVSSGYQVAVLAPTTVLVQQHFQSFVERFAETPYNIGMLSRFCSSAEQNKTLEALKNGSLDIIIGTHRLCGSEVKYKNLGLVVIDEEQRFGVRHKEKLRQFRTEVDVLSMSATPIPRTLYMAMAGARDLSTLMTAPLQRLPVKTVVAPENDEVIIQAIKSELARGGQVYFLHNRVKTIEDRASKLRNAIPDAIIEVAHGQMDENQLEDVMQRFLLGQIDCLVCSIIIESGLDVPNANTIIIERADRFGLAELYQLRGRVGRSTRQAYAYLLVPKSDIVSSVARKRLAAIRSCANLGAGFQLAVHDLEIRGSGNILGNEQSGHMASIGFDYYCHLLKKEVMELKGQEMLFLPEVEISIDFIALALKAPSNYLLCSFPRSYIEGENLRIQAYRKIAGIPSLPLLEDYKLELIDRFGKLPPEALNLFDLNKVRILLAQSGYRNLACVDDRLMIYNSKTNLYRDPRGYLPRINLNANLKQRLQELILWLEKINIFRKITSNGN